MSDLERTIRENVVNIRQRIEQAAARAGRDPQAVTLVGVTKYVDPTLARMLAAAGCNQLGESRPQQLWEKAAALQDLSIDWHMIGHLQTNKAKRTAPLLSCLQAGDRTSILTELDKLGAKLDRNFHVLLEVNISGDVEKHGFTPAQARELVPQLDQWPHLRVGGLMAMSARDSDAERARQDFAHLRQLRDDLQVDCPSGVQLQHLSMGMSRDFEVAIEEGATLVRVGSALFAGARH